MIMNYLFDTGIIIWAGYVYNSKLPLLAFRKTKYSTIAYWIGFESRCLVAVSIRGHDSSAMKLLYYVLHLDNNNHCIIGI